MDKNRLYFGDNLDWLRDREHFPDEFVDLIYLDPPFNSRANYNKIFSSSGGGESVAQARAFDDTWDWAGSGSETAWRELAASNYGALAKFITHLAERGDSYSKSMAAYLSMMGVRMIELRRVLKPTGSIYLHCDPTASHYLKMLMDAVFGAKNFRNEIVWRRYGSHNDVGQGSKRFGRVHDIILLYGKSSRVKWNQQFTPLSQEYVDKTYSRIEEATGRRFTTTPLTGPGGAEKGNPVFEWNGHTRAWRYSRETMERLEKEGRLYYSRTGYPRQKLYLDESRGVPVQDVWEDIYSLSGGHTERRGYPTQKPEALLERIIRASSEEDDMVLDPFCGCGTTAVVAQHPDLKRRWIGIDVTYLAINEVEERLQNRYPSSAKGSYQVYGRPMDEESAWKLARRQNKQFELWAVSLVGAHPRDRDRGADGIINLVEGAERRFSKVIVQVKGKETVHPEDIRALKGTVEAEKAVMGLFVTLAPPTKGMVEVATHSGKYRSPVTGQEYPVIQIRTIKELIEEGKKFELPPNIRPI